jgi:tetratricopeptide (TPR) repeat protein
MTRVIDPRTIHHPDEALSRLLHILVTKLLERGERGDAVFHEMWSDAVICNGVRFDTWRKLKKGRDKKPIKPSRGHWIRLLNIYTEKGDNFSKYILDTDRYPNGQTPPGRFEGLSFNQIEDASKVLVTFGYASDRLLPVFDHPTTWDRVFKAANAELTDELKCPAEIEADLEPVVTTVIDRDESRWLPASNVKIRTPTHFMGRDAELAKIHAALNQDEDRIAIVALHGLRGVGKTIVAATYAHKHRGEYRATWWIEAETEESIHRDLISLGLRLRWLPIDQRDDLPIPTVMENLSNTADDILLIFDNATDPKAILPFVPKAGRCRILITSNWDAWRKEAIQIEIDVWPKETGAEFLIARTTPPHDHTEAETLSIELEGLPLALEQAAAYCEGLRVDFAEYKRRLTSQKIEVLGNKQFAPLEYYDRLTVEETFNLAIDEATKLNSAAEALIHHIALLAPDPVPLFLFAEARDKFGEPLASALGGDGIDQVVAALRTFALVDRESISPDDDASTSVDTIRVHRLIREVAASRCQGETREEMRRSLVLALATVCSVDGSPSPTLWVRCAPLIPHILTICQSKGGDVISNDEEVGLLIFAGDYCQHRAAFAEARRLFERALVLSESAFGPEHPSTGATLNFLAVLLSAQGNFAEARPLQERALVICEKTFGSEHAATAISLNNLARLLYDQGDLAGAGRFYDRALAVSEKALGSEHPHTVSILDNIANLQRAQGDLIGARQLNERALAIYEKNHGSEDPLTAAGLTNLGRLLQAQGAFKGAQSFLDRALAISEKVLGPEHPNTATCLDDCASLLQAEGALDEALPLKQRALAIREKAFGHEHAMTAASLNSIGTLLQAKGDLSGARLSYERALATAEKALGPSHPKTELVRSNLAGLLKVKAWPEGSRVLRGKIIANLEKICGRDHPWMATAFNFLAAREHAQGFYAEARYLYARAFEIREKMLGPEHPDTLTSANNLATLFVDQGDYTGARRLYQHLLPIREKMLGPEHPDTAVTLNNLGDVLHAQGEIAAARVISERALAICEKSLGPRNRQTAAAHNTLARVLQAQEHLMEARAHFDRALIIRESVCGHAHPDTATTLDNLAGLLHLQEDYSAAQPLYERALAIREKWLRPGHPDTGVSLSNLAGLLKMKYDFDGSRRLLDRALSLIENALGSYHPTTAAILNNLADLLLLQEDIAAARPLFERALDVREMMLGPWHRDTATSLNNLAFLLRLQEGPELASPLYERALAIRETLLGPDHADTLESLIGLTTLPSFELYLANAPLLKRFDASAYSPDGLEQALESLDWTRRARLEALLLIQERSSQN